MTVSPPTPTPESTTKDSIRQQQDGEAPAPRSDKEPEEPRLSRIARRAHELYETRGAHGGRDLDDWLQAEREIDAEIDEERERQRRE
jgi:hypothetical protein